MELGQAAALLCSPGSSPAPGGAQTATPLSYTVTQAGWKEAQLEASSWLVVLMDSIAFQMQNKKLIGRDLSHFSEVRKKAQ